MKERVSRTPNSSCDQNQTHVTFSSHLQRTCAVEHASSSNVPGTTTDQGAHNNPQLHTRSVRRPVLRLNTSLSYYLGKRIANDDYHQDLF
ncbi:hypothetical protein TNCV_4607481 [Trichonephila clavipes]|nr:hypothetical protein TNCV_4607481 [Trichonephila clavipes]